jgi:hypothetical protein
MIEAVNANVVIKWARDFDGALLGNRGTMDAATEQVDFDQMDLAIENLLLLAEVKVAAVFTGRFVRGTENLNGRY